MSESSSITLIVPGCLVRLRYSAQKGEETHYTFHTERIAKGVRIGSVLGRIVEVCNNGCCVWVQPPEDEESLAVHWRTDELLPLLKEDTNGSAHGEQYT